MSLGGGVSAQDHSSLPYEDARPLPTVRLALEGKDPHAAVNLLPVLPPVEDGVPVTVTNSDGEPVASVSVVVVDNKQVDRKIRMQIGAVSRARHGKDMEFSYLYILSLYGKKFRTDKQGRAKVTRARRGLFAVVDGRQVTFGNFSVREGTEPRPVSVVFSRPKGIDVLVVDSRGKPVAQVPVALVQHWSHGHRH